MQNNKYGVWIKIQSDDDLPCPGESVLIMVADDDCEIAWLRNNGEWWGTPSGDYKVSDIEYWTPLPEFPNEQ